jgi:two-component system sporulation sensor kinase A
VKHILLLSPDATLFRWIKTQLAPPGYTISSASVRSTKAVDAALKTNPDLVLMDVDSDGYYNNVKTASRIIHKLAIPAIIIADHADDDLVAAARDSGAAGLLLKPVDPGQLKATIEIALACTRAKDERAEIINIIENTNDLIYIMDGNGVIKFINNRVVEKLGYTRKNIIGRSFSKFVNPPSFKNAAKVFERQVKGEEVGTFELELVAKNGDTSTVEIREILKRENGRIVEIYGIGRDISIRRRAEEALRREKDRAQQYLDIADVILIVLDATGAVTLINKKGCEILGYPEGDILGKNWFDHYIPEQSRGEVKKVFARLMSGTVQQNRYVEDFVVCRDGTRKAIGWHNTLVTDEKGKIIGTLSSGQDITESKRARDVLSLNERRLEGLLQLTRMTQTCERDIIQYALDLGVDLTGSTIGYFHFVNPNQIDLSLFTWSRDVSKNCKAVKDDQYPIEAAGIWMDSFRERKPVIHNDYQNLPKKKGYPKGHIHVTSHMSVPVFDGETIIAVAGVGNKELAYDETDVRQLSVFMNSMWEIVKRKRSEETLRESEGRYRSLFEHNPDPVCTIDLSGKFQSVNRRTCIVSGYSEEELLGVSFETLLVPDRIDEGRSNFLLTMEGHMLRHETSIIAKDGRRIEVDITGAPIIVNGEIVGIYGIAEDITEKKRIEAALVESEEKYRMMVENISDVVMSLDLDGTIRYIGPAIYSMSGYRPDEVVGESFTKFIHPDDLPGLMASFERSIRGTKEESEFRAVTKDGSHRYVRSLSSIVVRDGAVVGLTGVLTDIDRRKKAEEALRESEQRLRNLFETSRDVVYISTIEGTFIDINPAAEKTFGYTHDELLKINSGNLYKDPKERKHFKSTVLRDGFVKDYETQMEKKDGTIIDCLVTAVIRRDSEGTVIGYQGIIRDVTERLRLRRQIAQSEKLSSLGAMISGVAHEINNPLTSIIGNTQLMMRQELSPYFSSKLEVIQRESVRCTKIVAGLLSFAREHRPERQMINLNDVINESLKLRAYDLKVNNILLETDLDKDIPLTSADPYQLQQVFINLVNNSRDALGEKGGGTLSIKSSLRANSIHIVFADDGPGIPPSDISRVFDPFFTTKDVGKGTGLGLSIVYGIINEHGGTIEVRSQPRKGVKFTIVLPLVETSPSEA